MAEFGGRIRSWKEKLLSLIHISNVFLTEFLILAVMVITAVFARKLYLEYPDEKEETADNPERIPQ